MSGTGRVPCYESLFDLNYRRKLSNKLTLDLGARQQNSDYTSGSATPSRLRDDWLYVFSTGLGYSFTSYLSANLPYAAALGRNAQDDIVNEQTREFDQHLVSLGALLKF